MRTYLPSTQRHLHGTVLKNHKPQYVVKSDLVYLDCNMHQSTDPVDCIGTSLIFKLKYMGLQDISYSLNIAFTLILYFTLLGSTCFGVAPSTQLYDPSPGYHFNKRCIYHISSNSCAVLGLVELF